MLYLISYDLIKPDKNYEGLYEAIKNQGDWWHYLDSTWLVDSVYSSSIITKNLKQHMDENDHLLVIQVTKDYDGWLKQEAWDWIKNH